MLKRKFALVLTLGAALSGLGVASAFADSSPTLPAVTTTTVSTGTTGSQGEQQDAQEGVDEQSAANDVAGAAVDVQAEADNQNADDQSGDQQGPNDQSGDESGD